MDYIVRLTGSPYFKSAHYLRRAVGASVVQRSKRTATRMTRAEAEGIAASWCDPNGFTAEAVPA